MQEGHPGHVKEIRQGRFFVDGTRRLLLGAELHNSSSSTETQIGRSFERVRALGATTVLAPIAWETIEPDEGRFDFTLVDFMLETARSSGLGLPFVQEVADVGIVIHDQDLSLACPRACRQFFRVRSQGKGELKDGAVIHLALDRYSAAVHFDELLHDGQP